MEDIDEAGLIYDAKGIPVAVADLDRLRPDEAAGAIAQAIVLAINTACGFDSASNFGEPR